MAAVVDLLKCQEPTLLSCELTAVGAARALWHRVVRFTSHALLATLGSGVQGPQVRPLALEFGTVAFKTRRRDMLEGDPVRHIRRTRAASGRRGEQCRTIPAEPMRRLEVCAMQLARIVASAPDQRRNTQLSAIDATSPVPVKELAITTTRPNTP